MDSVERLTSGGAGGESRRLCRRLEPPSPNADEQWLERGSQRRECDLVSAILDTAATLVVVLDGKGRIVRFNRVCQQITGYTVAEVRGKPFCELLIVPDEQAKVRRWMLETPAFRGVEPEEVHWRTKDGTHRRIAWSTTQLLDETGAVEYAVGTGTDMTERRRAEEALRLEETRLKSLLEINQKAAELSEREVIQLTLDLAVQLTQSQIGYLHPVNPDQESIQLFAWSTETLKTCSATHDSHYPISQAGVWADCARQRRPVVHNDYQNLENKAGYPVGHSHLIRHASVPIMDGDRVVLILGVGNKSAPYDETDVRQMLLIGDYLWKILRRMRAEELLRYSESRYRTLVETSPDAIFLTDLEGRFLAANRQFLALYGYDSYEEIQRIGLRVVDLVTEHHRPRARLDAERTWKSGMVRNAHYDTIRKDGSVFPAEVSLSLILDDNSRPHGIMGLSRDITDRQNLEEELRQHVRALEEADRRRSEFLAMLAHELRNPLAPIRSAVDILRRPGAGTDLAARAREVISRQVEHLVRLVDDLLDVSRITRGKIDLRHDRIPLDAVLHSGMEISRTLIDACGHELNVSLPEASLCVVGDGVRLAQVVANLLNNAAKYTPEHGRIWLELEQEDNYAVIHVRDTGIGIPPDLLPRIFDLFVQADRSLDRARGGLGLGLTLVRQLVELHGGTVLARSDGVGKGSEFSVRLPLDGHGQAVDDGGANGRLGQPLDAPRRILIVDDHADSAAMLAELLRMHGQEVRTAGNGATAIQVAKSFRPNVVLLDIGMPGMDGFEIARRLRSHFSEEELRLIALSGFGHPEAIRQSQDAGFQDHVVKPVDLRALLDVLAIPTAQVTT